MDATQIEMSLRQRVTAPAVCRCHLWHPAAAAAAAARQRALAIPLSSPYAGVAAPSASRRILLLRAAAEDSPPGSGAGPAGAAPPGFLQNPAIAQREALRLFYSATTVEAQQRVLDEAGALVDAGTRCGSLLGRTAASNVVPCTLRRWGHRAQGAAADERAAEPTEPTEAHGSMRTGDQAPGPCTPRPLAHCIAHTRSPTLRPNPWQPALRHAFLPAACSCCAMWRSRRSAACCPAHRRSRWVAAAVASCRG